ncbi:exocyst complex component 6B-like isoform X2 [Tubulanus polymorphus]|uniref:exocyst complex component 6B-like isoform X2 n=1 Tax=Tubulanus polymorphus TaxID=672921 RepID=UPI003DA4EEAD
MRDHINQARCESEIIISSWLILASTVACSIFNMADVYCDRFKIKARPTDSLADQENLLHELEIGETGSIAVVIRSVYESDEPPTKFMEKLDQRIKNHDKEIERMCNYHYQGFIESIRELLQVRTDAGRLQEEIRSINELLQVSGKALLEKGAELINCRKIQKNIALAIERLNLCQPVLQTYKTLKEQMKQKRYYPALKTLEQLEHTHLPRVHKYKFAQIMAEQIPKLREDIKEASMSDLRDFLENIRKHSSKIGEIAMKHAAEQNNFDPSIAVTKEHILKRRAPPPPNPFSGEIDDPKYLALLQAQKDAENDEKSSIIQEVSAQDVVDFAPVYRCLHIYSVLGARETFELYYRGQRTRQARLALQPPQNMHESIDAYKKFFHVIVGFFVIEDHVLNTTSGLVNRAYIDELWEMALTKLIAVLRTNSVMVTDPQLMLQLKSLLLLLSITLQSYGFPMTQLQDLLLELKDQYNEVLMKKWVTVFDDIFSEDNYTPICVEKEEKYLEIKAMYPFHDEQLDQAPFPKRFPFSNFVPEIYIQVKEYIYACLKFSEDLQLSKTEIDDMVRKSANILLTRTLSACLQCLIRKPSLTLLQLIQISINMNYLEQSCGYLEEFISNIIGSDKDSVHVGRLHGTAMFKDARSAAEEQIYTQLNKKIDEFLEDATYDWMMSEAKGSASSYMLDLLAFLQSTFMSFTNLPQKVAQTACMSSCQHIARALMEFLVDSDVPCLTMGAINQLNLDLMQCEVFASSEPVPGFNEGTLQMAFMDLRQVLDLFITWDWSTYLADYGQAKSKYLRVHPNTAITLLEKLKDADKRKNNLFTYLKKNEKDRKRLLETVLKQLRGLQNGTA